MSFQFFRLLFFFVLVNATVGCVSSSEDAPSELGFITTDVKLEQRIVLPTSTLDISVPNTFGRIVSGGVVTFSGEDSDGNVRVWSQYVEAKVEPNLSARFPIRVRDGLYDSIHKSDGSGIWTGVIEIDLDLAKKLEFGCARDRHPIPSFETSDHFLAFRAHHLDCEDVIAGLLLKFQPLVEDNGPVNISFHRGLACDFPQGQDH